MSIYNKNIKNNIITVEPKKIYQNYVVVSDDTLWNIAKKQSKNIDTRILVEIIKDDNNLLNSDLKVGQILKLRREVKKNDK